MRLFEAILAANHRAAAGDKSAGLHPAEFADSLPIAALTCIDVRLNALLPSVLGLPAEQFIWLRNAGNIVTGPLSSTMRSLALACAVKGAEEICIIGHTDCQVCKTTTSVLLDRLQALGVQRQLLPENVSEFFGTFASERQNVIKACGIVRGSPLIGPKIPVHGLVVDIATGKLEWLVNGYETFAALPAAWTEAVKSAGESVDQLKALTDFNIGEMKFPETKIGETVVKAEDWLAKKVEAIGEKAAETAQAHPNAANLAQQVADFAEKNGPQLTSPPPPPPGKKLPLPPPVRPKPVIRRFK